MLLDKLEQSQVSQLWPQLGWIALALLGLVLLNQLAAWVVFQKYPGFLRMAFALFSELFLGVCIGLLGYVIINIVAGMLDYSGMGRGLLGITFAGGIVVGSFLITVGLRAFVLKNIVGVKHVSFLTALGHILLVWVLNVGLVFMFTLIPFFDLSLFADWFK